VLLLAGLAVADPGPVWRIDRPLYPGFASVPWQAAWSPDGRWIAVAEGWTSHWIAVYDARTLDLVWKEETPDRQTAALRPVFTADGERLVHSEDDSLVVRARSGATWERTKTIPLGVSPGVTADVRPVVLSPDEKDAAACLDGRVVRVALDGSRAAEVLSPKDVAAVAWTREGTLRVARWSAEVAETAFVGPGETPATLPFAVLASSPNGKTWLVARRPRPGSDSPGPLDLEVVDAESLETLGPVVLQASDVRERGRLTQAEFTADGARLVTIETLVRATVRDARTGSVLQRIDEYEGDRMIGFAVSPDGGLLLTGGRRAGEEGDRAVLLWRRVP
jgi:hypothetical protein